jgi:hypothetical protein
MFIIDEKGKLIEGQPLTEEEAGIYKELINRTDGIYAASQEYINAEAIAHIARYLIGKFEMRRRIPSDTTDDTSETLTPVEPISVQA